MTRFNSLGSNFTARTAWSRLVGGGHSDQLAEQLGEHYGGVCTLTYKGREALRLAIEQASLAPDAQVAVNGFTCYVVCEAVQKAGKEAIYVDVAPNSLHFSAGDLEVVLGNNPHIGAVVVQNTLGIPCDISKIEQLCKQHGLVLIEDLAHSIGSYYDDGREVGTVGDFVMLSFSQDKTLDVVAGGALIDRRPQAGTMPAMPKAKFMARQKNRWYPVLTLAVRRLFNLQIGKLLLKLFRMLHLLSRPMDSTGPVVHAIDSAGIGLLTQKWAARGSEFSHRQKIVSVYEANLPESIRIVSQDKAKAVQVRYPIFVDDRASLLQNLQSAGFQFADTWYDVPVGPAAYFEKSGMQVAKFPNAKRASERIVNLPTHIEITEKDAQTICATINQWLSSK
jgi:perosamine synthetase